jgi:hypothetical protein
MNTDLIGRTIRKKNGNGTITTRVLVVWRDKEGKENLVPASVGKRKVFLRSGKAFMICRGKVHKGKNPLPCTQFSVQKVKGHFYMRCECKKCFNLRHRRSAKVNRVMIPLSKVTPYMQEVVERCGGKKQTAKITGLSMSSIQRWSGGYDSDNRRLIHGDNAAKIINLLDDLRKQQK